MSKKVKFSSASGSRFYATVRSRVEYYFIQNQLSQHANAQMWGKTVFFLTGFIATYVVIVSGLLPIWMLLPLAVVLGMFSAFVGFNVCHDAIHGALSDNKKVNKLFGFIFNLVGANPYVWSITHNVVHHTYTNIPGHDEDI